MTETFPFSSRDEHRQFFGFGSHLAAGRGVETAERLDGHPAALRTPGRRRPHRPPGRCPPSAASSCRRSACGTPRGGSAPGGSLPAARRRTSAGTAREPASRRPGSAAAAGRAARRRRRRGTGEAACPSAAAVISPTGSPAQEAMSRTGAGPKPPRYRRTASSTPCSRVDVDGPIHQLGQPVVVGTRPVPGALRRDAHEVEPEPDAGPGLGVDAQPADDLGAPHRPVLQQLAHPRPRSRRSRPRCTGRRNARIHHLRRASRTASVSGQ